MTVIRSRAGALALWMVVSFREGRFWVERASSFAGGKSFSLVLFDGASYLLLSLFLGGEVFSL